MEDFNGNTVEPEIEETSIQSETTPVLPSRKRLLVEVSVVLALGVIPHTVNAISGLVWFDERAREVPFIYDMLQLIVGSVQIIIPILALIWIGREGWSTFGIVRPRWIIDPAWAIGLCLVIFPLTIILGMMYNIFFDFIPEISEERVDVLFNRPESLSDYFMLTIAMAANGIAEELMIRAYLMTRLLQLLRSKTNAILLSSALFALYHVYQGVYGTVFVFVLGCLYGVVFLCTRRIFPVALGHFIHDMMLYVL